MKRLVIWAILLGSILLIINLSRSIADLFNRQDIVSQEAARLEAKRKEHEDLSEKLEEVQDPAFIERQARDKLNLAKEGEIIVIVPNISPLPKEKAESDNRENWEKWKDLFRL